MGDQLGGGDQGVGIVGNCAGVCGTGGTQVAVSIDELAAQAETARVSVARLAEGAVGGIDAGLAVGSAGRTHRSVEKRALRAN